MISPLRRIAASLTGLAVGVLFITTTLAPSGADAQSTTVKHAPPPATAHGKSAVPAPSSSLPHPAARAPQDRRGAPARDGVACPPPCLEPSHPRARRHGARRGQAAVRAEARAPALLCALLGAELPLSRPHPREPQSPAPFLRRRRRT